MIVNGLIYGMFLGGVLLSQYPLLMSTLHGLLFRLRIRADLIRRPETARYRAYGPFLSHICKLTESTGMSGLFGRPEVFVRISVLLGAGIAGALNWVTGPVFAVITGIFSALLPYMGLRLKLNQKRVGSSREGDTMLRELLSCYKIHDSNMKEAIEAAAAGLEGAPHAKRLLYDLAGGLNRSYPPGAGCISLFSGHRLGRSADPDHLLCHGPGHPGDGFSGGSHRVSDPQPGGGGTCEAGEQ